jgi:hypothetical protein
MVSDTLAAVAPVARTGKSVLLEGMRSGMSSYSLSLPPSNPSLSLGLHIYRQLEASIVATPRYEVT